MEKKLAYYMSLPYRIELTELTETDGGGIELCMPELGRAVVLGWGETFEEAKTVLKEVQKEVLSLWLKEGVEIPEPDSKCRYSGRFMVRIPAILHQKIAEAAKRNKVSINQYVTQALSEYTSVDWALKHVRLYSSVTDFWRKSVSTVQTAATSSTCLKNGDIEWQLSA